DAEVLPTNPDRRKPADFPMTRPTSRPRRFSRRAGAPREVLFSPHRPPTPVGRQSFLAVPSSFLRSWKLRKFGRLTASLTHTETGSNGLHAWHAVRVRSRSTYRETPPGARPGKCRFSRDAGEVRS